MVAMEMNASETAFLIVQPDGYNLRWFTPTVEVDLRGHATLASAHILWEEGVLPKQQTARFHTRSGLLTAVRDGEWIEMDFPSEREHAVEVPSVLKKALGVDPVYVGQNRFDLLVALESEEVVRSTKPDFKILMEIYVRGIIVTSSSISPEHDFVSRFFCPSFGVNEDPATGSVHCCLRRYWGVKLNKKELIGYQASSRGGVIRVRDEGEKVKLLGQAVTVLQGELTDRAAY